MAYFIEREREDGDQTTVRYYIIHIDAYGTISKRQHVSGLRGGFGLYGGAYIFGYRGSFYIYMKSKLFRLEDDGHGGMTIAHGGAGDVSISYLSTDVYIQGTYVAMDTDYSSGFVLDMDSRQIADNYLTDRICEYARCNIVIDGDVTYEYSCDCIEARSAAGTLWKREVRLGYIMSVEMVCDGIHVMWIPGQHSIDGYYLVYVDHRTFDFYHLRINEDLRDWGKITCQ